MVYVDEIKDKFIEYRYGIDTSFSLIHVADAKYDDEGDLRIKMDFSIVFYSNNEIYIPKVKDEYVVVTEDHIKVIKDIEKYREYIKKVFNSKVKGR